MPVNNGAFTNKINVTKQILINQQLDSHYRKIQNVRATVDTSTPYTFTRNPTTHGYRAHKRSPRPGLESHFRLDDLKQGFVMPERFSDDQVVDNIVKEFLKDNPIFFQNDMNNETTDLFGCEKEKRMIGSARSYCDQSRTKRSSVRSSRSAFCPRPGSSDGDVLKRFQHKFTEEKPFSPRTMKTKVESKLRRLRCYNPPVRVRRLSTSTERPSSGPGSAGESRFESNIPSRRSNSPRLFRSTSRPSPRASDSTRIRTRNSVTAESIQNLNPSDRDLARATIVPGKRIPSDSRAGTATAELQPITGVSLMQTRLSPTRNNLNDLQLGKVDRWLNALPDSHVTDQDSRLLKETIKEPTVTGNLPRTSKISTAPKITEIGSNQDDICYLNFIEAVTSDALARGVFTDRNLNWLLDEHMARNEFGLTQDQLQQATESLRNQLKISDDSQSAAPLRISSSTWTTAASNEGHAMTPRTTLSGDTNDSVQLGSSGMTVSARVLLTSLRPPPAPARTGSNSGVPHRGVTVTNTRTASPTLPQIARAENSRKAQETAADILESSASLHSKVEQNSSGWTEQSMDGTNATAPAVLRNDLSVEYEDTLNDQATIPNSCSSTHNTGESDIPQASPPESDDDMDALISTPAEYGLSKDHGSGSYDLSNTRQPKVKFAPKPEIFVSKPPDVNTSASTLTELTQLSSGEAQHSSIPDAEPDISSIQAIAEGDSNFSFEMTTSPKGTSPILSVEDRIASRTST